MKPPKGFAPMSCCWSTATMQKRLPFLAWLPDYTWHALKMDFIAGISVGLTVIPQALAYAEVAGLPPQVRCVPLLPTTSLRLSLTPLQALVLTQEQSRNACIVFPPDKGAPWAPVPWGPRSLSLQPGACDCLWADACSCNPSCHACHTQAPS